MYFNVVTNEINSDQVYMYKYMISIIYIYIYIFVVVAVKGFSFDFKLLKYLNKMRKNVTFDFCRVLIYLRTMNLYNYILKKKSKTFIFLIVRRQRVCDIIHVPTLEISKILFSYRLYSLLCNFSGHFNKQRFLNFVIIFIII